MTFPDRESAGHALSELIEPEVRRELNPIVVAIPKGGVPVACAISEDLDLPLSLVVVKKLGLPWNPEAGFGAIDPEGSVSLDQEIVNQAKLDPETIREIAGEAYSELQEKEKKFISTGYPDFKNRQVFVVDDGVATGYTAMACCGFLRRKGAREVIVAVPVAPKDAPTRFKDCSDKFIAHTLAEDFSFAVGNYYQDFNQLSDEEVEAYLKRAQEKGLLEL